MTNSQTNSHCGVRIGAAAFVAGLSLVGSSGLAVATADTSEGVGARSVAKTETGRGGSADARSTRPAAERVGSAGPAAPAEGSNADSLTQRRPGRTLLQDRIAPTSALHETSRASAAVRSVSKSMFDESPSSAAASSAGPEAVALPTAFATNVATADRGVSAVTVPTLTPPTVAAVYDMTSPALVAGTAPSARADAVAAAPSITAAVAGFFDNAANWLAERPAESATAFLQGALLLVRRARFSGPATNPAAASVSQSVDGNLPIAVSDEGSFTTIYGTTAAGSVTVNGHTWVADPTTHLYTTTSDLAQEWQTYYSEMKAGRGTDLNDVQRLAGNAQAVFENTDLKYQPEDQLSLDRQDVQKALDAVYAAMIGAGFDPNATLTEQDYVSIDLVLQNNPTLVELAVQGHGLNNSGIARYAGYTNHFQNNVDRQTRYVGPGLNSGQNALANFFDDNVITHLAFPTVVHNGVLWQLNQNGNRETTVADAVTALNISLTTTYDSSDFLQPPALVNQTPKQVGKVRQPFSFTLPADTFVDPQGETITYTATRIFGIGLPRWLSFDAQTQQFSGTAPFFGRSVRVFVKATNESGLNRTESFVIQFKR